MLWIFWPREAALLLIPLVLNELTLSIIITTGTRI
jgi:hypothetical protein